MLFRPTVEVHQKCLLPQLEVGVLVEHQPRRAGGLTSVGFHELPVTS